MNAFSLSLLYIRIKKLVLKFVAFQYLQFQEQSFIKNLCIYYFVTGMNSSFLMHSYLFAMHDVDSKNDCMKIALMYITAEN